MEPYGPGHPQSSHHQIEPIHLSSYLNFYLLGSIFKNPLLLETRFCLDFPSLVFFFFFFNLHYELCFVCQSLKYQFLPKRGPPLILILLILPGQPHPISYLRFLIIQWYLYISRMPLPIPILYIQLPNEYIHWHVPEHPKLQMFFPHLLLYVPNLSSTRFSKEDPRVTFLHFAYLK